MSISPAFLDELRARTTLSTLIGKTVKVTKAGREFKACCPFHNEMTPSFTINDDKGFYHCFGCGAHGDAIRWMTDQRGLPFMDAVKELAATAGLEVPAPDRQAAERQARASTLHDAMQAAADWFVEQLAGPGGAAARGYLDRRGITPAVARTFGIGLAPDSRTALRQALARFGDPLLIEAGLLISVEGKAPYDRFRGRLMIPIRDARGRVIAFGGRILGEGEPKYLNSPDTPLFDKGRTLYNIDRALPAARKAGRIIVVEGYMDAIALDQAGIGEVVAPLGTALTEHHLDRLWRIADVPMLCFDGDAAGQKAAMRAAGRAMPLLQPGRSLAFLTLPAGQDPDDLVRAGGRAAFDRLADQLAPLAERVWEHELAAQSVTTPEERAGLKQRLGDLVRQIQHPDVRDQYQQHYRARFDEAFGWKPRTGAGGSGPGAPVAPWRAGGARKGSGGRWQVPAPVRPQTAQIARGGVDARFQRAVIAGLLRYPDCLAERAERIAGFAIADPALSRVRDALIELVFTGQPLEPAAITPILAAKGLESSVSTLAADNGLAFSFLRGKADAGRARRDLIDMIDALHDWADIRGALAVADHRAMAQLDDASFAEQQRLRAALNAAEARLADWVQQAGTPQDGS